MTPKTGIIIAMLDDDQKTRVIEHFRGRFAKRRPA